MEFGTVLVFIFGIFVGMVLQAKFKWFRIKDKG